MLHTSKISWLVFFSSFTFLFADLLLAHCDSMEGPVVKAAQKTLETANINYVLIWIKQENENEVKNLFEKVNKVRNLNDDARELADIYFFETVVRIHRMGEGEPYTGLKPVGYKPDKGIETADIAVETNSIEPVLAILDEEHHSKIKDMFDDLRSKKDYKVDDVKSGREYVAAYVHFIHYVEELSGTVEIEHLNK